MNGDDTHVSGPPFSPAEARAARHRMGMTIDQVSAAIAQLGIRQSPELVEAWESGARAPSEIQLFALADALWCPTPVLMAVRPRTLQEHRLARQLTRERLAHRLGMEPHVYARAETEHHWTGDEQQTRVLAEALGLQPDEVLDVIGQGTELIERLKQAIEGRWKSHVGPLADFLGADEKQVAYALRVLHQEYAQFAERYMGHLVARSGDTRLKEIATERARWLRRLPEHFRELVGRAGT